MWGLFQMSPSGHWMTYPCLQLLYDGHQQTTLVLHTFLKCWTANLDSITADEHQTNLLLTEEFCLNYDLLWRMLSKVGKRYLKVQGWQKVP